MDARYTKPSSAFASFSNRHDNMKSHFGRIKKHLEEAERDMDDKLSKKPNGSDVNISNYSTG